MSVSPLHTLTPLAHHVLQHGLTDRHEPWKPIYQRAAAVWTADGHGLLRPGPVLSALHELVRAGQAERDGGRRYRRRQARQVDWVRRADREVIERIVRAGLAADGEVRG